jgi:hypothetical protein
MALTVASPTLAAEENWPCLTDISDGRFKRLHNKNLAYTGCRPK